MPYMTSTKRSVQTTIPQFSIIATEFQMPERSPEVCFKLYIVLIFDVMITQLTFQIATTQDNYTTFRVEVLCSIVYA